MAAANDSQDTYETRIDRLIREVARVHLEDQALRGTRKSRIPQLHELIEASEHYAELLAKTELPALDGNFVRASHQSLIVEVRRLAEDARAELLFWKDWREKTALGEAAWGLLHIRHHFGHPPVSLYDKGPDVQALDRVCRAAGIVLTPSALRAALKKASENFVPRDSSSLYRPLGF